MRGDPYWLKRARFGKCAECGAPVKGKRALYFPLTRSIFCEKCGETHWRQFLSEAADEEAYQGCGNPFA